MRNYKFQLGWNDYFKPTEIDTQTSITFFIKYNNEDACLNDLEILDSWLIPEGVEIEEVLEGNSPPYLQGKVGEKIVVYYSIRSDNAILIKCINEAFFGDIAAFLNIQCDEKNIEYRAELKHGLSSFKIGEYKGLVFCGDVKADPDEALNQYKFYELKDGEKVIAKALLSYCNGEMNDVAPTIELIEVLRGYKRKHIGSSIVRQIESDASSEGFNHIWATDMDTSWRFWEKLGYEVDIDEALKTL